MRKLHLSSDTGRVVMTVHTPPYRNRRARYETGPSEVVKSPDFADLLALMTQP